MSVTDTKQVSFQSPLLIFFYYPMSKVYDILTNEKSVEHQFSSRSFSKKNFDTFLNGSDNITELYIYFR